MNISLKKIFFWFFILIILTTLLSGAYFIWKVHDVSSKISVGQRENQSIIQEIQSIILPMVSHEEIAPLRGQKKGRINILLLGKAGENYPGKNLTDTIMVMNLDTRNQKMGLLSLPRDLYVNIPETKSYTKINAAYQYGLSNDLGIEPVKSIVEKITGLEIHYFLMVDFEGFKKIIDDIGGINVEVERDIYDPRYPGPNYSYELFEIKKGWHQLDGETALKYARERHDDPEGDFGRAKRQQKVIQAVKSKTLSLKTFLNFLTINRLLNTLGEHVKTDIQLSELENFIELSKKIDTQNITNAVVDAWKPDSLLKVSHVFYGHTRVFILVPRVGNYNEVQELAENLFHLDQINRRQEEIKKEEANIGIINTTSNFRLASQIRKLFQQKLNLKQINFLSYSDKESSSPQTLVIDRTEGAKPFSLDEIVKKLPAKFYEPANPYDYSDSKYSDYDFIIILGKDLVNIYRYEDDQINDLYNNEEYDNMYLELIKGDKYINVEDENKN